MTHRITRPATLIAVSGCAALAVVTGAGLAAAATTYSVVASIPLSDASCPNVVSVDAATHDIYVVDAQCGGSLMNAAGVTEIDGATNKVTAHLPLGEGRSPQGYPPTASDVVVDPASDTVYEIVSNGLAQVSVIDGATNAVTATIPLGNGAHHVAVDPVAHTVYVTTGSAVSVIDEATNQVTGSISLPAAAGAIAADPATSSVYVATGNNVSVINGATNQVSATIALPAAAGAIATDPATSSVYVATGNNVSVINGATNQVSTSIPLGFGPAGLAVDSAAATVYVSSGQSSNPVVSVIDGQSDQVIATVAIPGGYYPAQLGIDSSTHTAYASAALGELPPEGTVFAIGTSSTGPGQAPAVTTTAADAVTSAGATLNGSVNAEGQPTSYQFDYGTTINYGTSVPSPAGSAGAGTTMVSESAGLTGLQPSTTYHFRLEATNATGTTYGADQSFTTAGLAPAVSTTAANAVTSTGATLNGSVNAEGQPTTYQFDYGTTTGYGSSIPAPSASAGSGINAATESAGLTGLQPSTTYHYRLEATNATGTTYGADQTFTTGGQAPAVTTTTAGSVTSSGATVHGSVNAEGQPTTYWFDYGITTGYGSSIPAPPASAGSGTNAVTRSAVLTGLRGHTTYHYRIVATNATGTSYGADRTFTTLRRR